MNEWKGLWRCEKCVGKLVPHDRRAPDPEKQELGAILRRIKRDILEPDKITIHVERGQALLHRYKKEDEE